MCWNCGGDLAQIPRPISRHATCPGCFNELHCCRLCKHFSESFNQQCDEDRADPPIVKENANFCDWFAPRLGAFAEQQGVGANKAQSALENLFSHVSQSPGVVEGKQPDKGIVEKGLEGQSAIPDVAKNAEDLAKEELQKLFGKD